LQKAVTVLLDSASESQVESEYGNRGRKDWLRREVLRVLLVLMLGVRGIVGIAVSAFENEQLPQWIGVYVVAFCWSW
jgi:hypothetical protein